MRVDTDDFARPCGCGKNHHIEVKEILIEEGVVEKQCKTGFSRNIFHRF